MSGSWLDAGMNNTKTTTTTRCYNCDKPIFLNAHGAWSHTSNTTSIPRTCYIAPWGQQTLARPA